MGEWSYKYEKGERLESFYLVVLFSNLAELILRNLFFLLQWAASDVSAWMFFYFDLLAWLPRACPWLT